MPDHPNLVVVIADDLGYGDLGCHGNTVIETPRIDEFYDDSVRFTRFYGGPICSPSRAELMTGRYSYRTGVVDTARGRSRLRPDEITLAETLSDVGYRTGLFGKWHLGAEPPSRPEDCGFDETCYFRGGGLVQPGNLPANASGRGYFDPVCTANGDHVETEGYCTDVFTDAAIDFVTECTEADEPFFAYLATNAPHTPLQVPEDAAEPYRDRGCSERRARLYGMISNLDSNVGRLLDTLEEAGVADDTVVVFTSDHGPAKNATASAGRAPRFNAGFRGGKSDLYEGGIRVPFLVRWPDVDAGAEVDRVAHFPDVFSTLVEASSAASPDDRPIDGCDLKPFITDEGAPEGNDRRVVRQCHLVDEPELYRNCTVIGQKYKLVDGTELYDLQADPGETGDIAARHPEMVADFRETYETWFDDVTEAGFDPVPIEIGHADADPVLLTRMAWRGLDGGWREPTTTGYWPVEFVDGGTYRFAVTVSATAEHSPGDRVTLRVGDDHYCGRPEDGSPMHTSDAIRVDPESTRIAASATIDGTRYGAQYVEVTRVD